MLDIARQTGICRQARFVLWSLRCAVLRIQGDEEAEAQLALGLALAQLPDTAAEFRRFADTLFGMGLEQGVWHHPCCSCVSTEELAVLRLLAETAERQRRGESAPCHWWGLLLQPGAIAAVDLAARRWLAALELSGAAFPEPKDLIEGLRPIEALAEPPAACPAMPSRALH